MIKNVFLIKEQDFQDYDKIMTFLSNAGIFTLLCQGINKPASHNRGQLLFFMEIEIEYFLRTKNKVGKLKTAKALKFYKNIYQNDKLNFAGKFILKILSYIEDTNTNYQEAFDLCKYTFEMLNANICHIYSTFYFMWEFLKLNKIFFDTTKCVRTQQKSSILSINLQAGGFISEAGFNQKTDKIYDKEILETFRQVNAGNLTVFQNISYKKQIIIWKIIYHYYINELGYFLSWIKF